MVSGGYLVVALMYASSSLRQAGPVFDTPPDDAVVFTAAGDVGVSKDARRTLDLVGRARPDFHLVLGDLGYAGRDSERRWCDMVSDKVGPQVPVQLAAGNHEDDAGEDGHISRFAECLPDRMGSKGDYGQQYWFDVKDQVRVVVISPDLTIHGHHYFYGENNADYQWLSSVIDDARAAKIPGSRLACTRTASASGSTTATSTRSC